MRANRSGGGAVIEEGEETGDFVKEAASVFGDGEGAGASGADDGEACRLLDSLQLVVESAPGHPEFGSGVLKSAVSGGHREVP